MMLQMVTKRPTRKVRIKANLLAWGGCLEFGKFRYWEKEHDQIEDNVETGSHVDLCDGIDAATFVFAVPARPGVAYWHAFHSGADAHGEAVAQ